ncbi:LPXTG cell wall anchor domain-containing protein [Aerococcus sp. NPDC058936]|uniref:LPXTG cell wall anchor domain-containing protein n=1 Tax=Aerococcus sp. NPDC058936 TaxID=3346674 RepID=UPI003670A904
MLRNTENNKEKGIPDNKLSIKDQPRESDKQLPNTGETAYYLLNLMGAFVVLEYS